MRVLGIDPGLTRCGVGVVEGSVGRPLSLVDVGVVRTAAELPIEERLCLVAAGIEEWLDATRPDAAQVGAMVTRLLRLVEAPKPADAADALALAICHIWRGGANSRIEAAVAAQKSAQKSALKSAQKSAETAGVRR